MITLKPIPDGIESHESLFLVMRGLMPTAVESSANDFMNADNGDPLRDIERKIAVAAKKAEFMPKREHAMPTGKPSRSNLSIGSIGKAIFNLVMDNE